ncbi:unnamed protein product [Prunus armeniaca]
MDSQKTHWMSAYMKISGRHFIILVLYVDDILLACTNLTMLQDCKSFLFKHFDMTDMAEASYVLGIDISRNQEKGFLGLSQRSYIDKVLKRLNMQDCVGSDVPTAKVSMLGRFQSNPGQAYWVVGKKVMRYLQRTKDYKLVFKISEQLELQGFADVDFAGCQDTLKSTSACYEATSQAMWLRNFIISLSVVESIHRPIQLWNDNSAVTFAKGNKRTRGSRLLDVKFIIVKEKISQGYTTIDHIGTNQMIAYPLTKGVPN